MKHPLQFLFDFLKVAVPLFVAVMILFALARLVQ